MLGLRILLLSCPLNFDQQQQKQHLKDNNNIYYWIIKIQDYWNTRLLEFWNIDVLDFLKTGYGKTGILEKLTC